MLTFSLLQECTALSWTTARFLLFLLNLAVAPGQLQQQPLLYELSLQVLNRLSLH